MVNVFNYDKKNREQMLNYNSTRPVTKTKGLFTRRFFYGKLGLSKPILKILSF